MCGRFSLTTPEPQIIERFRAEPEAKLSPRYNIAPTQECAVILGESPEKISLLEWGLVSSWAKEPKPMINARAEGIAEKPMFRKAFKERRCLVLADGFYEWKKQDRKIPFMVRLRG